MSTVVVDDVTVALWQYQGRQYYDFDFSMMREAVKRVNLGATLLDNERPEWAERILPQKLDMSSASFCIIGQSYGSFDEYVGVPFGMELYASESATWDLAIAHGFLSTREDDEAGPDDVPYSLLDRVWVYMLSARSIEGRPVTLELPSTGIPVDDQFNLLRANDLVDDQEVWTARGDRYGSE